MTEGNGSWPPPKRPLEGFHGRVPPRPDWFTTALTDAPARTVLNVEGAGIEMLTWGERGRPGLLLLHGHGAHADWWSFIAPFFARDFRVVALSWSGMGGSDWRERYTTGHYLAEAMAVSYAGGLFDSDIKPIFVGHSFGAVPLLLAAGAVGARMSGGVVLDSGIRPSGQRNPFSSSAKVHIYDSEEGALARFRLAPDQPCATPYIADWIARRALRQVVAPDGRVGWTWRFDPELWTKLTRDDAWPSVAAPGCPLAFVSGQHSLITTPAIVAEQKTKAPPGTPFIEIADAHHHLMIDQPLALVAVLRTLFAAWPGGGRPA